MKTPLANRIVDLLKKHGHTEAAEKLESSLPSDTTDCSPSSDTPETNKFRASLDGMREINQRDQLLSHARKLERERNRLAELLDDYQRDKWQIGKDLGLSEDDQMHHRFQRRAIMDLQMLIREAKRIQKTDAPSYEQLDQLRAIFFPENSQDRARR